SVQTILRKFNRYSFFETPKVLLLAWDRVFEIKDALGTKKYKPEDLQELFRQLSNDVQNIHEELAEYINIPGWNRPAFYDDDDDVLSLAWETILEIELAFEDKHCQPKDILELFRRLHNDVQNSHEELAVYINTLSWDCPIVCYNDDDEDCTIAITPSLSTREPENSLSMGDEHLDTILETESDEFIKSSVENLVPNPSESEGEHECDVPTCENFITFSNLLFDADYDFSSGGVEFLQEKINQIDYVKTFLRKFNQISFYEMPKVLSLAWETILEIELAFEDKHCQPKDILELFRRLHNDVQNSHEELAVYINTLSWDCPIVCYNDDDEDCTIAITPSLSTREPENSLSMGDEHLDTILETESDEFIKSSVENLVPNPSESEGEHECDVNAR
nr:hypothetical protein [Tanacetum cinerariifolium]